MTIKKIAKGYRKEKLCADELKAQGYTVWKTIRHKFLNIDLFHLYDVVACAADGSHLRFIQVKSNKVDNKTRDAIRNFKMPKCCKKEVWIWKDRVGWKKEIYE